MKTWYLREYSHLDNLISWLEVNWRKASLAGKPLRVEVSTEGAKRSQAANRHYFGAVLRQISDQVELDGKKHQPEVFHELFKRKFIGLIDLPGGGTLGKSSSDLSSEAFAVFVQEVEAFAATELGVIFIDTKMP